MPPETEPEPHPALAEALRTDVTLAACGAHAWLVRGEHHIDDLLFNTLPAHLTVGIVACPTKSAVDALWRAFTTDPGAQPWLIHPAIVARAHLAPNPAGLANPDPSDLAFDIAFAPWSAAIDPAAAQAVRHAAAAPTPASILLVRADLPAGPATQLAELRCALIAQQLEAHGVPPARLAHHIEGNDPDTIILRIRP